MNDIVKEYGGGLFSLALESGMEQDILAEVRVLFPLFTDEYVRLLINPDIPKPERLSLVSDALDGRVNRYLSSFVKLMTERGIADDIRGCFTEYERLYYETSGIVRVTAESTVELSDAQKARLSEKLSAHVGHPVEITYVINRDLIGGMRLSYNNKLIDDSVAAKLKEIGERLSGVVV